MERFAFQPAPQRAIAMAIALLALALALYIGLRPFAGPRIPFLFFLPALGIAAAWLGWRPAILVLFGCVVSAVVWLEPPGTFSINALGDRVSVIGFAAAALVLLAMGDRFHRLAVRALEAERELAREVRELQILQEMGSRLMQLPTLDQQFAAILETLCAMLGASKAAIAQFDVHDSHLHAVASTGFDAAGRAALASGPAIEGPASDAFERGDTVIVEDALRHGLYPGLDEFARTYGVRSVHCRPLASMEGHVFGVLSVYFDRVSLPSARDNHVAEICGQAASVLAERESVRQDAMALSRQVEVALESSAVPFCLFRPLRTADGTVVDFLWDYLNGAAARALGRSLPQVLGRTIREIMPTTLAEPGVLEHGLRALETGTTVDFEFQTSAGDTRLWYRVIASPCEGGLAVWFSNTTQRKLHEQQLQDADRRKDEFLATLAHELRNPLAPIRQAAMIARAPSATAQQQRWSLDVIDRQVSYMAVLLDDLLDVSRITRGKLELRRHVTDLRKVLDAALESAQPSIEARKQHLSVDWPLAPLWADVDPMRMSQVLSNLLANACKYTQTGGSIWLRGRAEGGRAIIEVRDNGVGIPPDSLERIFEMFTQVQARGGQPSMGLGIGLALSRGLAQMHGGTLVAASPGIDRGSTFTLTLALTHAPAEADMPGAPSDGNGTHRRILVADDNRDAADSLAEVLRMSGHDVIVAYDGTAALESYRTGSPEVALLDIGMPGLTGNEVAAAIRSSPGGENAVLVAITGWGQERDRAAARSAGFDFHLTKPVNPEDVLRLIDDPERARAAEVLAG